MRIAKQKKPKAAKTRAAIHKQLEYLRRNLEDIEDLLLETSLSALAKKWHSRLTVIRELYRQQSGMHENGSHQCEKRIVSLRQPHVRPMVRGKAGRPFEFGQKLALSVVKGYTFIVRQSFENFHEGVTLIQSVERYRSLHGCYPEVVQADQIYRNRKNLAFCKEHGIRLSGPRLGRPEAKYQRCAVHFYRNMFCVTPNSKGRKVAAIQGDPRSGKQSGGQGKGQSGSSQASGNEAEGSGGEAGERH